MTVVMPPAISVRRRLTQTMAAAVLLLFGSSGAPADQDGAAAQSSNPFADLGLTEMAVTVTNDAFEGVPATLPSGRYVLSVTNAYDDVPDDTAGAALLRLPDGIDAADFIALAAEDAGAWPADWYYETTLAGGAYAALGETAYAVIDLSAGEWMLWSEAPGSPQEPVPITVTGTPPPDPPTPIADIAVELSDFEIAFSAPLRGGQQTIEVDNTGRQPHFLFIGGVPDGTTVADAQAAFAAYWDPESAPSAPFSFAESPELVGTGDQSAGTSAWYAVDLPAGALVVACFVTDPATGEPHAVLGMTVVLGIE